MRAAIEKLFNTRSVEAAQSQYDAKVCVRAVGAARDVWDRVAIEGTAPQYGQRVLDALEPVYDDYNDPDGEYTSGKAAIGDVFYNIMGIVQKCKPPDTK